MPLYDYECGKCGLVKEVLAKNEASPPLCCDEVMNRQYGIPLIKIKYPLWVDRIDDIHKSQADKGQRFRFVHPKEVGAN
uniref:Putative regulatory protein FmdB zinc ribbon domain-containing protein n=1 Tax=viral metagenome TaxID=1070528 RepID=A0A6M3J4T9_9ZZZZ